MKIEGYNLVGKKGVNDCDGCAFSGELGQCFGFAYQAHKECDYGIIGVFELENPAPVASPKADAGIKDKIVNAFMGIL